jgi:succinate-semialdehyde dehydrogenase/glutarate-semialdehyde dehydrogenase
VELANNFNLVWEFTKDTRGEKLALQLEAGSSFVNKLVWFLIQIAFGGIKNKYGRELAAYGIREFVNTKNDLD